MKIKHLFLFVCFGLIIACKTKQQELENNSKQELTSDLGEYFNEILDSLRQLDTVITQNPRFQELFKKYRKGAILHPEYHEKNFQHMIRSSTFKPSKVYYDSCLGMSLEEFKEFQSFVDSLKSPFLF